MSTYINITTKQYPLHQGDIRLEVDGIGDEFVCPEGYAEVQYSPMPMVSDTQNFVEEAPILLQNGTWVKQFRVFDMTAEEIAARARWMAEEAVPNYRPPLDNDQPGSAPNVVG